MDDSLLRKFWEDRTHPRSINVDLLHCSCDITLHIELKRFWQQEHAAILPAKEPAMCRDSVKALNKLETETKFAEDRYTVPMLRNPVSLPDSSSVALKRFGFLLKRLHRDTKLHERLLHQGSHLLKLRCPLLSLGNYPTIRF